MAWNEPGGNKPDPWGGGGNRGNDGGPPDLDEALRKLQQKLSGIFGGGSGGGRGGRSGGGASGAVIGLVLVVLALVYFFAGIQIVNERERAVVLRFGVYDRTLGPGFNWAPPIIDRVYPVNVTNVRLHRINGSSMLTGDLNIVEVDLSVQYSISNAEDFVLRVRSPESSLREATDSALRHVVGATEMHEVLTEGRSEVAVEVQERLQEYLDAYQTGILVEKVNVEETTPPREVQSAFDDVNRAREDEERVKNEAQAYVNRVIPEARGRAQRMIEEAQGYREQVVSRAEGDARRFEQLLTEYTKAPEVTRERLYLDAVQSVMANSSKILMDVENGNNLLYLPLDKMMQQAPQSAGAADQEAIASEVEQRVLNVLRREQTTPTRRREVR
ncbi:FtsH protease activity modulator HflK [Gilvimarinus sp. F26214L]|uniref:FtsH protease activity modulator HflK n=1 Tax=Gilvimarinus sp. DZF01 TaxID=3461371 RepID=UPI004046858E